MRKPFFSIVTNKGSSAARINIYGVIGPDWWGEGNEAKDFIKQFNELEAKYSRIDIHINSPGGSIWDGLPMFNAIRASKVEVHTYIDGIALSMGAIIALAGDKVHAAKGSLMMIHNAGGMTWGHAKDMRASAEMLDKHDTVLANLIADKTGKTVEAVMADWMNFEDNFFTAQEAFEAKLVDLVEDYDAENIPEDAQNMTTHQLVAFYNERQEEPNEHLLSKIVNHVKNQFTNMKFTNVAALAGVENATEAQLEQANADLTAAGITKVTLVPDSMVSDAEQVTTERNDLQNQVNSLTTERDTANSSLATTQSDLSTAQTDLATAQTRITELETENTRLGTLPGSEHEQSVGQDEPAGSSDDEEYEKLAANMAHNRKADSIF